MVRVHAGPLSEKGGLAQLARAPALQAGGHRFDSDILHRGDDLFKERSSVLPIAIGTDILHKTQMVKRGCHEVTKAIERDCF